MNNWPTSFPQPRCGFASAHPQRVLHRVSLEFTSQYLPVAHIVCMHFSSFLEIPDGWMPAAPRLHLLGSPHRQVYLCHPLLGRPRDAAMKRFLELYKYSRRSLRCSKCRMNANQMRVEILTSFGEGAPENLESREPGNMGASYIHLVIL